MFKKLLTSILIISMTFSVFVANCRPTTAYAEDAVTLKKGDKILIGNDYWRVLDPDHANNGEDGIFITLDTYNEKYNFLSMNEYLTGSPLLIPDNWSSFISKLGPRNTRSNDWLQIYTEFAYGEQQFTEQYNTMMKYYYTFIDGYLDDYAIKTYKDPDEDRIGTLDSTDYWKNIFEPYLNEITRAYYETDGLQQEYWDQSVRTTDKTLVGKIAYRPSCSKITGSVVFPLSVAELNNSKYFSNAQERKLYDSSGKSINYWTRNHFLSMSESTYLTYYDHKGYPSNGFSFVQGSTGDIIDDYTGEAYSASQFNDIGEVVNITRPAMNLKKDILSKLSLKESIDGVNTYYPNFTEDSSMANVKAGDVIKMGGIEWIVLDPETTNYGGKGIFVIAKDYVSEFGSARIAGLYNSTFVIGPKFKEEFKKIYNKILKERYGNYILNSSRSSDWDTSEVPYLSTLPKYEVNDNKIEFERLFLPSIHEINTYLKNIEGAEEYKTATSDELRGYWTRNAAGIKSSHGNIDNAWDFAYFGQNRLYPAECKSTDNIGREECYHYLRPCMNLKYSTLLALEENNEGLVSDKSKTKLFKIKGIDESLDLSMTEDDGYVDKKVGVEDKIYRLYNKNTGEHLFTSSIKERVKLTNKGWQDEKWSFEAYTSNKTEGLKPVYRVYNPNAKGGDHHYTKSEGEMKKLIKKGWKADFKGKPVFYCKGDKTTYKLYDKKSGRHHYTPKKAEADKLEKLGWKNEGVAWEVSAYNSGKARVY